MKNLVLSKDVSLPVDVITERLAVVGQSGSGKTYAAMRLAELMLDAGAQIAALDPMGVWWGLLSAADGKASGYAVSVFGGSHAHVPIVPEAGALVAEVLVEKQISAVVDLSHFTRSETVQFAIAFAERFFKLQVQVKRPVHLFFEEAQTFMPQNLPKGDGGGDPRKNPAVMLNRVELLVRQGRSQGVGCTMITQAPQAVAKSCLNQAGTLIAMRTMGKHERKAIGDWMADKATDDSQLKLDQMLPKLNTGEAWVSSPNFLGLYQHTHISKKTTYDSSATPKFGVRLEAPKVLADVDVAALRASMKTVVEQVEKDDPRALQKEVARLKAELAKKPAPVTAPPKEVPVLTAKDRAAMTKLATQLESFYEKLSPMRISAEDLKATLKQSLSARVDVPRALVVPPRLALARTNGTPPTTTGDGPSDYALVLLRTAASRLPLKPTRSQLAILAGRSTRSSAFDTAMAAILRNRWMESEGDRLVLTAEGLAHVGGEAPAPTSPKELQDVWLRALPDYPASLLKALIEVYPQEIDRVGLGEKANRSTTSSAFDTAISTLKKNGLAEAHNHLLRAATTLFQATA